jgi:pyruvate kinase
MTSGAPRRTKIVCTIGPATSGEEQLRALIAAGMNVARLNFSHGTHADHASVIERIRRLGEELRRPVAILQDLAGPKVRIGTFATGSAELVPGRPFTLTTRTVEGSEREVSVSYADLPREVRPGDTLLLADGTIQLDVREVQGADVHCVVAVGGRLTARKGVNVPSGLFGLPILRPKDLEDLAFGIEHGVDYVGLSFVRTAEDVRTAKGELEKRHSETPVIAKIETQAALEHFDAILELADGIMVARGDLGIETSFARVPTVQKELIAKANARAKPVITATQMLYSMVENPNPTRAEVADVANAVMDGTDAVMLSDETTVGKYPIQAVETMAAIATATEEGGAMLDSPRARAEACAGAIDAMALGACELAARLGAELIATLTREGRTPRFVAKHRPRQKILAVTSRPETYRRLALVRGVTPLLAQVKGTDRAQLLAAAREVVRASAFGGSHSIFVSDDEIRRVEL